MKKTWYALLMLPLAALMACEPSDQPVENTETADDSTARVIVSDMHPNCWFNENTLQKQVYHSKPFASRIDSNFQDSYGFRSYFHEQGEGLPREIDVRFWALFNKLSSDTKVVFGVDSAGTSIFWTSIDLKDSIKAINEWQKFRVKINTPARVEPADRVTVYVWSFDKRQVYIDDMEVRFIY